MELKDRVAVITGGGTGMGKATALLFAQEGAKVVVAGRREHPLKQTVEEITKTGGGSAYVRTDITDSGQVQALFVETERIFGKIDILFNNAGIFIMGKETQDFSEEEWNQTMNINFWGTLRCSKYVLPYMKRNGGGVIINCTSVSAKMAQRGQTPYNVSKASLEMLSKCMALELGKDNIRVNTICPSLTDTDMAAGHFAQRGREFFANAHPIRRLGMPIDIAYAALYLASERASWVSGNSLYVDGGSMCR
jgi:NAD(P)-dependent dehydrogenase (short-subunit alcohol dehydrogenase family)